MLTAKRFTTVPTKSCVARLEDAASNTRPIARGERDHSAVATIQAALADLNSGYMSVSDIDGFFGSRTYAAVEAFQRDYGLVADGIVGRQTMGQLDTLYGSPVMRQPRGMSVHVGVDKVDAAHYGDEFPLSSCVNDAQKMQEIAESLGYETQIYANEAATVANFTGFMRAAIDNLYAGDSLLITFSGHGSEIPNTSADEEADGLDETLCFFDRMLIDDELYALFGQFREGVNIHAVFDSCHSGTAAKDAIIVETEGEIYYEKSLESLTITVEKDMQYDEADPKALNWIPISGDSITKALDGDKPKTMPAPKPTKEIAEDVASLFTDLFNDVNKGPSKSLEFFSQIYETNKNLYDAIKNVVGSRENQELVCSVITLSACQDNQTTPAGRIYSLFTSNIANAWGAGFPGSYTQFHKNLLNVSPAGSTPAINTYGTNRANVRLGDRPFVF